VSRKESVLITGTTSGVGRALLDHYVSTGARVISVNRRRVLELEADYPTVRFECVDVRASQAVHELVNDLAASEQLPNVFILNAGINRVDNDESFQLEAYRSVVETNLYGVLNFVQPLTQLKRGRVPRHLVAVSSMARYVGNPYALGYTTSKQALTECFDVWSKMYAGTDLVFQRVMLGPVHTAIYTMANDFPSWMVGLKEAFSASPEATARAISGFARSSKPTLFYPRRAVALYLGMGLGRSLIPGFFRGRKTSQGNSR
jgi:NAD(P)-dependent dehydrogenase (short-subunit alcohol dehydrogenase family)